MRNRNRLLSVLTLLLCLTAPVFAAVTGEWQVVLRRASTNQPVSKGATQEEAWNACIARIPQTESATVIYRCLTPVYVATVTPDVEPPTCPPLPGPETSPPRPCPAGTTGTWTQTRTYSAAPPPTCSIAGEWLPTEPPEGACTTTPPPSGDTITNGQEFTITGSGFGSKSRAAPLVYDDFNACANGTAVAGKAAVVGTWNTGSFSSGVTCAEHEGQKVARHQFGNGRYNASLYVDPAQTSTVYLDFWIKGVPIGNPSRNWKSWRFYNSGDSEVGNSVYYCQGGGVDLAGSWVWKADAPPPQIWMHYEVIQRAGVSRHYRNGKLDMSTGNSSPPAVTQVRIGHYWGLDGVTGCGSNPGGNVYTDDVYVDNSIARVVLANAATFDGSTKRQVQRSTSWASDTVRVIGNTRGFSVGENAYVILMDAANVQRKAQAVTVQ